MTIGPVRHQVMEPVVPLEPVASTSGNVGRPAYNYPLGDSEWSRDEWEPNIPG